MHSNRFLFMFLVTNCYSFFLTNSLFYHCSMSKEDNESKPVLEAGKDTATEKLLRLTYGDSAVDYAIEKIKQNKSRRIEDAYKKSKEAKAKYNLMDKYFKSKGGKVVYAFVWIISSILAILLLGLIFVWLYKAVQDDFLKKHLLPLLILVFVIFMTKMVGSYIGIL